MKSQEVSTGINSNKGIRSRIKKVNGFDDEQSGNSGIGQAIIVQKILEILLPENFNYSIPELMIGSRRHR